MTTNDGSSSAGIEELKVDGAVNQSKVEITADELEKLRSKADKYHEFAGKYYKLKDSIEKPESKDDDVDLSEMDEKQVKLTQKVAKEYVENRERQSLQQKEEETFLKTNPIAYEKLDEIRDMKKRLPDYSYSKIYKFLFDDEPIQVKNASIKTTQSKPEADDNSRESINESFKRMTGH